MIFGLFGLSTGQHGIVCSSMSIEMLAAHPSPPEGNEPLVGMQ